MQPDDVPDDPHSAGFEGHVAAVRQHAIELRGAQELGLYTRTVQRWVLVGVSRPDVSAVLCIPKVEYDGLKLAALAGFVPAGPAAPIRAALRSRVLERYAAGSLARAYADVYRGLDRPAALPGRPLASPGA
jgi:hypothetical protein